MGEDGHIEFGKGLEAVATESCLLPGPVPAILLAQVGVDVHPHRQIECRLTPW